MIPVVRGFDWRVSGTWYHFEDLRRSPWAAESRSLQSAAAFDRYPADLLCDVATVRERESRAARRTAGGDAALLAGSLRELRDRGHYRQPEAIVAGDLGVLDFAVTVRDELVAAFEWYGIHQVAAEGSGDLVVRGGWFPAFPPEVGDRELVELNLEWVARFLESRLPFESSAGGLRFRQATAPVVDSPIVVEVLRGLRRHPRLDVEDLVDDAQPTRRRLLVTARGLAPIDEPEIDELTRERGKGPRRGRPDAG